MKLLRVACELETPAIVDVGPLHLDGVLFSASREERKNARTIPRLPVASVTVFGERIFLASSLIEAESEVNVQQISMARRRDPVDIQLRAGPLHRGLGPGKDKMRGGMAIDGRLVWYAVAGRARPVRKLLKRVLCLGRDIGSGHGRVRSWSVASLGDPVRYAVIGPDGRARRNLPLSWCASSAGTGLGALLPPYWTRSFEVVLSGTVAALRKEAAYVIDRTAEVPPKPRAGR